MKNHLHEDTAVFYTSGDSSSLADMLDRLFLDFKMGVKVAESAKERILPKFDYRNNAESLCRCFNAAKRSRCNR